MVEVHCCLGTRPAAVSARSQMTSSLRQGALPLREPRCGARPPSPGDRGRGGFTNIWSVSAASLKYRGSRLLGALALEAVAIMLLLEEKNGVLLDHNWWPSK